MGDHGRARTIVVQHVKNSEAQRQTCCLAAFRYASGFPDAQMRGASEELDSQFDGLHQPT
jgi:hypothetical protein